MSRVDNVVSSSHATERQEEVPRVPKQLERLKKRVANARKEIKCESYGFGEERRLHLFKKQNGAAPTGGGI